MLKSALLGTVMALALTAGAAQAQTFTFAGDVGGRTVNGTLMGSTGNITGTISIPSLSILNAQLALITPSTPGNETSDGTTAYRANDGTDVGYGNVNYPLDSTGVIFQVGTQVPQFGAFPIFAIGLNANGTTFDTFFTGDVNGTRYYALSGSATGTYTAAVATPGPIAGAAFPALIAFAGLFGFRRWLTKGGLTA